MKPNAPLLSVQLEMFWSQARGFEARVHFLSHSAREIQKKGILHLSSFKIWKQLRADGCWQSLLSQWIQIVFVQLVSIQFEAKSIIFLGVLLSLHFFLKGKTEVQFLSTHYLFWYKSYQLWQVRLHLWLAYGSQSVTLEISECFVSDLQKLPLAMSFLFQVVHRQMWVEYRHQNLSERVKSEDISSEIASVYFD